MTGANGRLFRFFTYKYVLEVSGVKMALLTPFRGYRWDIGGI